MEIESETEGVTITRWDQQELDWFTEYAKGDRRHGWCRRSFNGPAIGTNQRDSRLVTLPAEFSAWLAGEGPPEPPIRVGDTVDWWGPKTAVVEAVKNDRAWVWVGGEPYGTCLVSDLNRVPENQ
jgi:hypothetical protein